MKKISLFLCITIFLLYSCASTKQASGLQNIDDFKKYSYLLFLTKKNGVMYSVVETGTCFFVNYNKSLYFVSAKHLFTNFDPIEKKYKGEKADRILVCNFKKGEQAKPFMTINTDEITEDLTLMGIPGEFVDVYAYKVSLPDSVKVNSIEYFIPNQQININSKDSIFFWGFPKDSINPSPTSYAQKPEVKKYQGVLTKSDSLNYFAYPSSAHGASGSPVFSLPNGKNKSIKFVGIFSAINESENSSLILRYNKLTEILQKGN